ncbi:MAG: CDP-diacylglycerol--glycerol-3-phosphate 3-phosphatidyltransferase [Clostridiaceae bacterium]|jgi:CDP-diacylglycerol--glycerol-3-phosphate 3-phosphatidyltransferase|nr:CDP-diacylglycerol--glycerol-3-phosphate 3-phosphatidyltransferase [Clostridiaceae bacterium]
MNLPNKITLSRIFLIPLLMIFIIPIPQAIVDAEILGFIRPQLTVFNEFIRAFGGYIAAGIFIIASSTDAVDGYIARKRKLVTRFGKFLDPIADKLLVTAALLALVQSGDINGWAAMLIISREFIVTGLRLVAAGEGIVIAASKLGKLKTVLQDVAIIAALLNNFPISLITDFQFDDYAMLLAVIVTIYSLYDYIKKNLNVINTNV